ncbi:hypothetical protein HYX08_00815 [Candidatus Woesearchaeota archaeon]|nr:hypothetical protein [Candidatus Woesearchaeota archaeon]
MKKIDLIIYAILAAVIGVGIYTIYGFMTDKPANSEIQEAGSLSMISTGSTDSGDVAVDLTPIKIDDKNLVLSIALNTHSVELSQFDLKKITALRYNGKTAYPVEAPKIESHHSSGNMVFNVDGNLKDFTVTIKGIPKIEERVYKWSGR